MNPWENTAPHVLYKYLHPDRLWVPSDCRVRFSQRSVLPDNNELRPNVAKFGTSDEIWRFVLKSGMHLPPGMPPSVLIQLIAATSSAQERATRTALASINSLDQFGIFCLTERADSEQMWAEYADACTGFVVAFSTEHASFRQLTSPGKFGKVAYTNVPYGTYLGTMESAGVSFFFVKRTAYGIEREWRSIRALQRLQRLPGDVYLSNFDPQSVREIIIRPNRTVETPLRQIVESDVRYGHVQVRIVP